MSAVSNHRVDVLIIGAGQAGLATAQELQRRGVTSMRIIDRGPGSGGAWQHRWASLRLDDAHQVEDLPGLDTLGLSFRTAPGDEPAREIVADYYSRYERAYGLPIRRPIEAVAVTADGPDHTLRVTTRNAVTGTPDTEILARIVINASGTWTRPIQPEVPGRELFTGRQLRTPEFVSAEAFAGQHVIVVGGGTSAIGFVLELSPVAARVQWATRHPVDFSETVGLARDHARAAVAAQDEAARAGEILPSIVSGTGVPLTRRMRQAREAGILTERPMFTALTETGVIWPDGTAETVDAIIWAAGFRAEVDHLEPLGLAAPGHTIRVERGRAIDEPRLFLSGYGPQASTIGAARSARATAAQVIQALGEEPRVSGR